MKVLCAVVSLSAATVLWGQQQAELADLSLQELANIEVTSVAKKEQKLSQAPAAIFVLTQEDIRRSGATSLPEVLRLVPGLQVARLDAHEWAISARGFNGRWSNKLLVLVDGRTVYTPSFSGVYWDVQDMMLDDIERIEVIRGPGATMWGANAVNGIINILTKPGRDTLGGLAETEAGSEDRGAGGMRYGARLGAHGYGRVYSKYFNRSHGEDRGDPDRCRAGHGGFRTDWELSARDALTVQGDVFESRIDTAVDTGALEMPNAIRSSGGNLLGRWQRRYADNSSAQLQVYYDRYSRREFLTQENMDTLDLDFQRRVGLGSRHDILAGGAARIWRHQTYQGALVRFDPARRTISQESGFAQDDITVLPDRLKLTVGSKIEHSTLGGLALEPGAQVAWTPGPHSTLWASIARAVREPSRYEANVYVPPVPVASMGPSVMLEMLGNSEFRPERVLATEGGARWQPTARSSLDLAVFSNKYEDLATFEQLMPRFEPGPIPYVIVPLWFANGMGGRAYGVELSASYQPAPRWRLMAGYSWLRMNLQLHPESHGVLAIETAGESPEHQGTLRSWLDLTRKLSFDTTLYLTGSLPTQAVAGYARVDARLAWRPTQAVEVSAMGENLGGKPLRQFMPLHDTMFNSDEFGRSAGLKLTWRF